MWGRKKRQPEAEMLPVPDDIAEARESRVKDAQRLVDLAVTRHELRKAKPLYLRVAEGLIDRSGTNHYMQTLYEHLPEGRP